MKKTGLSRLVAGMLAVLLVVGCAGSALAAKEPDDLAITQAMVTGLADTDALLAFVKGIIDKGYEGEHYNGIYISGLLIGFTEDEWKAAVEEASNAILGSGAFVLNIEGDAIFEPRGDSGNDNPGDDNPGDENPEETPTAPAKPAPIVVTTPTIPFIVTIPAGTPYYDANGTQLGTFAAPTALNVGYYVQAGGRNLAFVGNGRFVNASVFLSVFTNGSTNPAAGYQP